MELLSSYKQLEVSVTVIPDKLKKKEKCENIKQLSSYVAWLNTSSSTQVTSY